MANKKISSLGSLGGTPDVADIIPITDVSDTTGSVNGTTKKVTVANLVAAAPQGDLVASNNLSDVASASTARTNLGLGTAATQDVGTANGNLVQLDSTGLPAIDGSQLTNLPAGSLFNTIVSETTTARTLSDSDCGKVIDCSNASAVTITIPSSVSAGFNCTVVQSGAGQVTIAAGASVNLYCYSSAKATAGQYASINIIPYASNSYVLEGDLAASGGGGGGGAFTNTYSVDLDGTNEHVIYNATSLGVNSGKTALGTFTGSMSFVVWFKQSGGGYESIVSSRHTVWNASTGASGYFLTTNDSVQGKFDMDIDRAVGNTLRTWVYDSNSRQLLNTSAGSVTLNAWSFVAYVFDQSAGTHVVYVGDESTTPAVGSTLSNTATMEDFASGFNVGAGQQSKFEGLADEFAIFDGKALSSSEVATIWNSGEAFDYSSDASLNPVGLFRMGDDDGGTGTSISNSGSGSDSADAINGASFVSGAGNTPGN
jgi:hypothetical protein